MFDQGRRRVVDDLPPVPLGPFGIAGDRDCAELEPGFGATAIGVGLVASHSLQTAGATMYVMLVTIGTMWGIEFPVALFLSKGTELAATAAEPVSWGKIKSLASILGPLAKIIARSKRLRNSRTLPGQS